MEKTKTAPTESQIQVVMSDWLGNLRQKNEGNYIHRGEGKIKRLRSASTSEYLLGKTSGFDTPRLIKESRMAAEHVITAVLHHPVKISVGGAGSYHTRDEQDREVINIATDYFDDPSITDANKADIMLGLASHEAAHGAYTDDKAAIRKIESLPDEEQELYKNVWNIIEDERIEFLLGDEFPGFSDNLGATKEYYFKHLLERMKTNGEMPTEPLPKFLSALTQAVRYPSEMTREQVEESFDELNEIRKILTPFPLNGKDLIKRTDQIMDVIRDMAKKQAQHDKQEQQKKEQQQQQQQGNQGGGSGAPDKNDKGSQQNSTQAGAQGNDSAKTPEPTPQEIQDALKKMLGSKQAKAVMDAIRQDENKSDGGKESKAVRDWKEKEYVNDDSAEIMSAGGGNPREYIFKPRGDQAAYMREVEIVRAYVPAMAKSLSCKSHENEYILQGLPSGRLNTDKLVSVRAGNRNIFDRQGRVSCSSASVVMLIDESGSMGGRKLQAARSAAVLVNEAIKRIDNVDFYCYGYTDDQLNVYSEGRKTSKWALSETAAIGGTPTGKAMELTAKRVRKFTPNPCLMLVVTDGFPDEPRTVIAADEDLRREKIYPVGIGILSSAVRNIFHDNVVLEDISKFAFDLGAITKKKLNRMLVRSDSEF